MTRHFDASTTADEVLEGVDLRGKRVLVTGVSSGLGAETARALAARGARIVGAARDLRQALVATAPIRDQIDSDGGFDLIELDLASLASVRNCADELVSDGRRFDIVIANAGVMATPFGRTADGFETQLATNHLGHFVLANRISPLINDGGRVVVLASASHRSANFSLDDLNFERTPYDPGVAYARSKTANVLFAVEFDRRHKARGVRAAAVHPGTIRTGLARHMGLERMESAVALLRAESLAQGRAPLSWKSAAQGAATTAWAAAVATADEIGGRYCENCHVSAVTDAPLGAAEEGVRSFAVDPHNAALLWRLSEELVGEYF